MRHGLAAALSFAAVALVGAVAIAIAQPAAAGDWRTVPVVLDGKSEEAHVAPADGDGSKPQADDLLRIGGIEILRGAAPTLRFRRAGERLLEIGPDGKETLVGFHLGGVRSADDAPPIDPLALPSEVLARLRGIDVEDDWGRKLDPLFVKLDGARCFIALRARADGTLPPLPPGLRVLRVSSAHPEGPIDLASLASQTELRALEIDMGFARDLAPLASAKRLARIALPLQPENAASLPALPAVRSLRLSWESEVADVTFVAKLPALRELDVSGSLVRDLSALAPLRELAALDASNARIAKLPAEGLPALRRAKLFGHRVPREELARFLAAHVEASIEHDRRVALETAGAAADGIRVRFVPGRDLAEQPSRTLWSARGRDEVRAFLDRFEIDDPASGAVCRCPETEARMVDLLHGNDVVASLRFRNAADVEGGGAGGDDVLTDQSLRRLSPWFAERGWREYAVDAEATVQARAASRRLDAAAAAILGADRVASLHDVRSDAGLARVVSGVAASAEERVAVCVRAHHALAKGPEPGVIERALRNYVRDIEDAGAVAAALDRMLASEADRTAAARMVVAMRNTRDRFPAEWFARSRLAAARVVLALDDPHGRDLAMNVLQELGTPESAPDLLRLLPAARDDGTPETPPTQLQVQAATLLARWCDAALLPRLRAIAAAAPGDEEARAEALRRFEQAAAVKR